LNIEPYDQIPNKLAQFEYGKLIKLNLSRCNISELPPGIFDNLVYLRELDLSYNFINYLPSGLFDYLKQLRILYLNHNKLDLLPKRLFDNLLDLQELTLHNNKLKSILDDAFSSLTELKALNLTNNKLHSLPSSISELFYLDWIDLRNNNLEEQQNVLLTDTIKIQSLCRTLTIKR
jgi:Leucine-rich repeat (LRR) protein